MVYNFNDKYSSILLMNRYKKKQELHEVESLYYLFPKV